LKLISSFALLSILAIALIASPANADTIVVANPSFEIIDPNHPLNLSCGTGCAFNTGSIPDWTVTGEGGSWQPSSAHLNLPLPDGSLVAYSNGGTISQTLADSLTANTIYTLSVDIGHRLDGAIDVAGYTIALFAGNTPLNSLSGSNGVIPIGDFADESFSYISGSTVPAGNLDIVLTSAGQQIDFDNVRLTTAAVPEPGSLALLAAALGLLIFVIRRR
jgi:hypothetical protein